MNNMTKHHGAGPSDARGPMQLHRLHRLKAGPGPGRQVTKVFKMFVGICQLSTTSKHFSRFFSTNKAYLMQRIKSRTAHDQPLTLLWPLLGG